MLRLILKSSARLGLTFVFVGTLSGGAHESEEHANLRHWEIASSDPDRVILTFHGDPATSRAVTWRTDPSVKESFAEITPSFAGSGLAKAAKRFLAQTTTTKLNQSPRNVQGEVNHHSVIFEELKPDTLYAYRVGDGGERWSEWIQFRTAAKESEPFQFLYFGDAQNELLSHWSRTIRMAYQVAPQASFAIHAGDLINRAHADQEWAEWFKAGSFIHAQWTAIPVTGNHEYANLVPAQNDRALALQWRPQFTLPVVESLPEELHETVYSVDYQGLRVIVLDSNVLVKEQTPYLEAELSRPGAKWMIVTCHHPIFSPRGRQSRNNALMNELWQPLFEKYEVDLVLQGHDHTYTRSQIPTRAKDGKKGLQTVYVTSVSGPKQYSVDEERLKEYQRESSLETTRMGESTQFFQLLSVDGSHLTYQAYTTTGELYDEAVITKNFETGEKSIREQVPAVPVRTMENTEEYTFPEERRLRNERAAQEKAAQDAKQ